MKARVLMAAAIGTGAAALLMSPGARAAATRTAAPAAATATATASVVTSGGLNTESEAFGVRVEYDIPVPASTGTVPHVVGDAARHDGNDSSHGISGAPSHLDAVIGGEYATLGGQSGGPPVRNLPQTECFYPGKLLDTTFRFPTDTNAQTAGLPATSVATAQCSSGPYAELHAYDAEIGAPNTPSASLAAVVHSAVSTADAVMRPVHGVLESDSDAHISDLTILGAIHIGSVSVSSHSQTTGRAGQATSASHFAIHDMTIAGVPVSIDDDHLTVAGTSAPLGSAMGQTLLSGLNASLAATGCTITVSTQPPQYPQGFLLARQPPKIGVAADGSEAASMVGGLDFLCNLPQSVTSQLSNLSPQRVQIIVGFAYTSVTAKTEPGGFGLGDVTVVPPAPTPPAVAPIVLPAPPAVAVSVPAPAATPVPAPSAPVAAAAPIVHVGRYALAPDIRTLLFVGCLSAWLLLTMLGIRRLRGVTAG